MVKLSPAQIDLLKMVERREIQVRTHELWGASVYCTKFRATRKPIRMSTLQVLINKMLVQLQTTPGRRNIFDARITPLGKQWLEENTRT